MQSAPPANGLLASWTFERGGNRLTVNREATGSGFQLTVVDDAQTRTFEFAECDQLVAFQSDMEAFLVGTGWSLVAFAPDRRRGRDRRGFPRIESDRRRWWTDVTPKST
jgi:hypothetical protein